MKRFSQRRALSSAGLAAAVPVALGLILSYSTPLVIAYFAGDQEFGIYSYALAWASMIGLMSVWGFGVAATKFIALGCGGDDRYAPGPVFRLLMRWTLALSLASCAAFGLVAAALWIVGGPRATSVLILSAALIPVVSLGMTRRNAAMSSGDRWAAELPENIGRNGALLMLLPFLLASSELSAFNLMIATVCAGWVCLLLGWAWSIRRVPHLRAGLPDASRRSLRQYSSTVGISSVIIAAWSMLDVIVVGLVAPDWRTVGAYVVATRIAALSGAIASLVDPLTAPAFAVAVANRNRESIDRLKNYYLLAVCAWAACVLVALPVLGNWIVRGLGLQQDAYWAMLVLSAGYLVNACTGPSHLLLTMGGYHRLHMNITIVSLSVSALLIAWGASFGLLGAAAGKAMSIALMNSLQAVAVQRKLRTDSTVVSWFRYS